MTSNRFIYSILFVYAACTLLLIFMHYNSAKNIDNLITGNKRLLNELKVSNQLRELERDMLSVENKIRGAVATNDTAYFEGADLQIGEALRYLESLRKISDNDSTLRNINRLRQLATEKLRFKNQILDSFKPDRKISPESFRAVMNRRRLSDEVNYYSRNIYNSRQRLLDSLSISISSSGRKARSWGTIMLIVVLVSVAGLIWYIIRRIRRQNILIHQLDASEKKLREVSMIKENFMANMSHEIRTPMNAILGFTNLLKADCKDPELTESVESIQRAGQNLLTIINDILDFSKIEAGMMRIESAPFSIRGLIHSIQTLFIRQIKEKGLDLSTVVDDTIPDTLSGDAARLTQILVNMIGNAIKFTPEGTIHLGVSNKGVTGNHIRIGFVMIDTGIGIEKEKLSGIFERFLQAEDATTRKFGGTGLGLSIVKDLILLQNGEIDVESVPGKGTTFRFTIPYELSSGQLDVAKLPEAAGLEYPDWKQIHILAVEDNEMNQNLLRHLFRIWRLSFDIVGNGMEALERLKSGKYHLVLMDIQMPVMDGYMATEEIRLKLKLDIPIIAMTAHVFAGEREKCLSHGMNDYIPKPIDEKNLYGLIKQFTKIENGAVVFKKYKCKEVATDYKIINLQYLQEISGGDKEYERTVTELFIRTIPIDLKALELAFKNRDLATLRQTSHNMKTNVSVMGLTEKLQSFLDEVEGEPFDEVHFQQIILSIKTICQSAVPEALHFYSTL